ncbi:MAG: FAD-dependent oxidoreductase [Pseudobdellovibrio sp.]
MSNGSSFRLKRRDFFIKSVQLVGAACLGSMYGGAVTGCSTLDDYLIDDQFDLDKEVVIIGGGIVGLYIAYELKKNRVPFKLFEASSRLGGKIQTVDNMDWGAITFNSKDEFLNKLVSELQLSKRPLPNAEWTLTKGVSSLTDELSDVVKGLVPEQQIRMNYRLSSVKKFGSRYQLTFQGPDKERVFFAKKLILALPQKALLEIQGLNEIQDVSPLLTELRKVESYATIRVVLPLAKINTTYKISNRLLAQSIESFFMKDQDVLKFQVRAMQKDHLVYLTFRMTQDYPLRSMSNLESYVQKISDSTVVLSGDNCKDWGSVSSDTRESLLKTTSVDWSQFFPKEHLRVLTESFVTASEYESNMNSQKLLKNKANISSIESLLRLASKEVEFFRLDM